MSSTEDKLRRSEERFSLATEASDNGIWDWQIPTHEVYFSPRWKSQVGYTDDELPNTFETWENLLHPDDYGRMQQELKDYLEHPEGLFIAVFRLRHKNGSFRWINNSAAALRDADGKPYRMVGSHKDISEQKATEDMLIRAKEKAEEADNLKSVFLSNMSHEIRTPMNSIIGFSNILMENHLSEEERKEFLTYIIKDGENLLHLLDDIIDMAKIEARQIKFVPIDFLLNKSIREIIDNLKNDIEIKNKTHIKFTTCLPANSDQLVINADPHRLQQILKNLINNAYKYTEQGAIEFGYIIEVPHMPVFYVKDTGSGISEDKHELIFERFGQVDNTYTRNFGGAGLGLSITKSLIQLQGGKIWLESEVGHGTTFWFHLGNSLRDYNRKDPGQIDDGIEIDWSDKTILIVEDVKNNYLFIEAILRSTHVNLLYARDGAEAISLVETHRNEIDLVLMDIRLPKMNGYDLTREIKQIEPNIMVIAVTAYALANEKEKCHMAGCCDYLSKPFNKTELIRLISKNFSLVLPM